MRWILALACISCAIAQTPKTEPAPVGDPALGQKRFESQCALCHGQDGSGGRGPNLRRPKLDHAPDDAALRKVIADGIQPEMPGAWQLVAARSRKRGGLCSQDRRRCPPNRSRAIAAHGEQVYQSKGCANCHMIRGRGVGLRSGAERHRRASVVWLICASPIVSPEASVPERFLMVEAVTASGATVRGIRMNEDSLHHPNQGFEERVFELPQSRLEGVSEAAGQES